MKRCWISLGAIVALSLAGSARAQTIVYDPTNYAKMVQQAETALQQLQQLQQQVSNGQTLLASLNTNSNANGLATILSQPAVRVFLPDTNAYVAAGQGGNLRQLGALSTSAQSIRSQNRLYTPTAGDGIAADIEAEGDRAARDLAVSQAIGTTAQTRLTGLQSLQTSLSTATDARAVLDLQARIQVEQAMIANDQMRLQGLAMTQAAEARVQQQRDRERMEADRAARMAMFKAGFQ
jgi:type IV secretion system protein VirB5